MSNWGVRLLINYLMIIHRLVIDYTSHTISSNFFSGNKNLRFCFLTIIIAKWELNLHVENQYVGHDVNRTANQVYLVDSNWNIRNEIFRRSTYLSYSLGYWSVSLLRNAATVECLPGKRSWIIKAFIVTFMPKKSLFLYFPFGMVCVPARLYSILNQWLIDDWKFCGVSIIHWSLNYEYRI